MLSFQEEVEEAATDGDSDHTDSVGSVDSKNACESAVILQVKYSYCGHNSVSFSLQLYSTSPPKIEDFFCFVLAN